MHKPSLADPVGDLKDKWKLLPHFLQLRGLMRQHIDSYNYFVKREIKDIVNASSNCEVSRRSTTGRSKTWPFGMESGRPA
jgi:DNA-directed RNA polymerase beta subunit